MTGDPTEDPWVHHEGCDQRIADLEARAARYRTALEHVAQNGDLDSQLAATHALGEGE